MAAKGKVLCTLLVIHPKISLRLRGLKFVSQKMWGLKFLFKMWGLKFLSKNLWGLKIFLKKLWGLKNLGGFPENTPSAYSLLKMIAP